MSSFESSSSHNHSNTRIIRKVHPDPIRAPPSTTTSSISQSHSSKLLGYGPHRSYRHLHHQRGTIGTFHVRLLEGKNLQRKHWSALSLGPVKHLGLSCAHGEVSSFGTCRLAFWNKDHHHCHHHTPEDNAYGLKHSDEDRDHHDGDILQYCKDEPEFNSGSGA